MTRRFDLQKLQPLRLKLLEEKWRAVKADSGKSFSQCDRSECLVFSVHEIQLPGRITGETSWFLDFKEITAIVNRIFSSSSRDFLPLTPSGFHADQNFKFYVENGADFTDKDASECIQRVRSWRQSYSPEGEIEKLARSLIPVAGGNSQLLHLAALAYLADYDTLMDYQKIFRRGKRLNFVPMIQPEMIDRAVVIAFERA